MPWAERGSDLVFLSNDGRNIRERFQESRGERKRNGGSGMQKPVVTDLHEP
jgi:hypothetical protein